jgi:WXG100 family type VII secretion target
MGHIHINYREMRDVAAEFERQADKTQQIIDAANNRVSQLMTGQWEGRAEGAFADQFHSCHRRMGRIPGLLSEIARAIRHAANKVEEAERRAAREMQQIITADDQ